MSQQDLKFLKKNGASTWALLVQNGTNWIPGVNIFWNNALGRLGIGPSTDTPANTVEVNSGTSGTSGVRLRQMNNTTSATAGAAPVGIDASGDLVVYQKPRILCDVYRNTAYTVQTTATDYVYDTAITNVGTSYNLSTGIFIPPENGTYIFYSVNRFAGNADTTLNLQLVIDGSVNIETVGYTNNRNGSANLTIPVDLTTSQQVKFALFRVGNMTLSTGSVFSRLKIMKVA